MTALAVSRREVTRALAILPTVAVPTIAAAIPRSGQNGDGPMNMHSSFLSAQREDKSEFLRVNWERAVHEWKRLYALQKAHESFGPYAETRAKFEAESSYQTAQFGSWEAFCEDEKAYMEFDVFFKEMETADERLDKLIDLADDAFFVMLNTQSPDLEGCLFKIDAINTMDYARLPKVRGLFSLITGELASFAA